MIIILFAIFYCLMWWLFISSGWSHDKQIKLIEYISKECRERIDNDDFNVMYLWDLSDKVHYLKAIFYGSIGRDIIKLYDPEIQEIWNKWNNEAR